MDLGRALLERDQGSGGVLRIAKGGKVAFRFLASLFAASQKPIKHRTHSRGVRTQGLEESIDLIVSKCAGDPYTRLLPRRKGVRLLFVLDL